MATIIIQYDPKTADIGGPMDLLSYLENEFNNRHIEARIVEVEPDSMLARQIVESLE